MATKMQTNTFIKLMQEQLYYAQDMTKHASAGEDAGIEDFSL
jgi:hypothetical protein